MVFIYSKLTACFLVVAETLKLHRAVTLNMDLDSTSTLLLLLKVKIKEIKFKIKPCKYEKYTENLNTVSYCVVLELFDG